MAEGDGLDLGRMVGPLPMGAWVAVVVVGLGFAWYSRRHAAAAAPAPSSSPDLTGGGAPTLIVPPYVPASSNTAPVTPSLTTNSDWYRQALAQLVAKGDDPTSVDRALRDYLQGNQLDPTENGIIQLALQMVGPPPQMPPGTPQTPVPVSQPINVGGTPYLKGPQFGGATIVDTVTNPAGPGGWELDSWGGIHPFGGAPLPHGGPFWPGTHNAVSLIVNPDGKAGYVIDLFGAPHPVSFS